MEVFHPCFQITSCAISKEQEEIILQIVMFMKVVLGKCRHDSIKEHSIILGMNNMCGMDHKELEKYLIGFIVPVFGCGKLPKEKSHHQNSFLTQQSESRTDVLSLELVILCFPPVFQTLQW